MKVIVRLLILVFVVGLVFQLVLVEDCYEEILNICQYVGGFVFYVDVDEDWQFDDEGLGYSVFYGCQLFDCVWWEMEGGFYKMDLNQVDFQDFYQYYLIIGFVYVFGDCIGFIFYVIVVVGVIDQEVLLDEDQDINLIVNVGIGVVIGLIFNNGLKLCGDVCYVYDDFDGFGLVCGDGVFGDVCLFFGVEILFGYIKVVIKEKMVIKICEVVVKLQLVMDFDGDGVFDNCDQCLNILEGGCVDVNGCLIVNQIVILININFEFDFVKLICFLEFFLDCIVDFLKLQIDFCVEVVGYIDSVGVVEYNEQFFQECVEFVCQYLINCGVDLFCVIVCGYGEFNLVVSNESEFGCVMNCCVEFCVIEK